MRDDREQLTRTVQEIFIINLVMTALAYVLFGVALVTVPRLQDEKLLKKNYLIINMIWRLIFMTNMKISLKIKDSN